MLYYLQYSTLVGGDALQLWTAAANMLNKQCRTDDKGRPPPWGLGVVLKQLAVKKISLLRTFKRGLGPGRIPWKLREEQRLWVFENRVLRRIIGPKRDEETGCWRKLQNEELHNLYSSPSIIRVIKSRRIIWAGKTNGGEEECL
jgi:hypothetical protein